MIGRGSRRVLVVVVVALAMLGRMATGAWAAGPTAYVTNYNDNTVTPIDVATNTPGAPITVGNGPFAVAITPAPPISIIAPSISGSAQPGQTLTAGHGSWTGNPTGYSEQWQDCGSSGAACADIPGATSQTYTLTATDVGHTIRVQETASNARGTSSPANSPPTDVVSTQPRGRVVLALSANPRYTLDTIKSGTPVASLRRRLAGMQRFQIGRNTWFVIPAPTRPCPQDPKRHRERERNRRPGADHDRPLERAVGDIGHTADTDGAAVRRYRDHPGQTLLPMHPRRETGPQSHGTPPESARPPSALTRSCDA